jgi:hypothetical protein
LAATLFFSIVTSAIGLAYIVYGKRQAKFVPLIAGVSLCAYSYFVVSWFWLLLIGALLLVAPWIIDR